MKSGDMMIITTAFDETEELIIKAKELSESLQVPYMARNKKTVKYLLEHVDPHIFVVNNQRGLSYYEQGQEEVFFHPNMAMHRIKQIKNGQSDSLMTACQLKEGMTFLDCTLGLASDTLVANYIVVPTGKVISLEKSFPLSVLVREGLQYYATNENPEWKTMIDQVSIINTDNLDYLKQCPDESVDVVYFDFMFNQSVESSHGIKIIKPIVSYDVMTEEHVQEALRVAKERVVVKSSYGNHQLGKLGFQIDRQNQKRHFFYGVIEKSYK